METLKKLFLKQKIESLHLDPKKSVICVCDLGRLLSSHITFGFSMYSKSIQFLVRPVC